MRHQRFKVSTTNKENLLSEINVTPFVDVLLVLLVVFMITAPLMTYSLNIELPQAKRFNSTQNIQNNPIRIMVDQNKNIKIDESTFTIEDIPGYLRSLPSYTKSKPVHIQMDYRVNHGFLIKLMICFKDAAFERVGLIYKEEK